VSATISQSALRELVRGWIAQGKRVVGPRLVVPGVGSVREPPVHGRNGGRIFYAPLESSDQLALEGFIHPANSMKEFLFPKHEELYGYRITGKGIELKEVEPLRAEQVLIAGRPCDAAALMADEMLSRAAMR